MKNETSTSKRSFFEGLATKASAAAGRARQHLLLRLQPF